MAPTTTAILIPTGTIVFELRNGKGGVEERPVTLCGDAYIDDATRHDDGSYGYALGNHCYLAAGGSVIPRYWSESLSKYVTIPED